ncbi:phosphotransferase family protein [Gemmatimonas sp.]|uniref:phosphotransferase family protein n=1 Tax=Gemmatimonas sp. TaxID=1962908 RepID=UPI003982E8C6
MSEETIALREGEEIDAAVLLAWLAETVPDTVPAGARLRIRQFPAGFSNLTYLITMEHEHGRRALVLRRPPRGVKAGIAHDVGREHGILEALHARGVPVPKPVARCDDAAVIGAPFYLMEHVDGVILRGTPPDSLTANVAAMPAKLAVLSQTFVQTLVQLHAVDVSTEPLASLGRPAGYVQRQVQGWTKRWVSSRTGDVPELDFVADWLEAHRPPDRATALVHNDFKLDNLVLEPDLTRVRAILDWEMATIGDPLMDLGTTLAYWVEPGDAPIFRALGLGITALPGNLTRAELVQTYGAHGGIDVSDAPFYYAFGLFKVAVIAQQIYARHVQGLTRDPRFGVLGEVVKALGCAAKDAAVTGRV